MKRVLSATEPCFRQLLKEMNRRFVLPLAFSRFGVDEMICFKECFLRVALLSVLTVFACQSVRLTFEGTMVDADRLLPLDETGPDEGLLKTKDLALAYKYRRTQDDVTISGTVTFSEIGLSAFRMVFHFTDAGGKIVSSQAVAVGGYDRTNKTVSFEQRFTIPGDTAGMAVSYEGRFGSYDNGPKPFWRTP